MDDVPTVYDVASLAGVSTATVSRFFSQPEKVAEPTRKAVESAVRTLRYVPSGSARGLAARRTGVFGMISFGGHEPDEFLLPPLDDDGVVAVVRESGDHPRLYPLYADEVLRGVELECTVQGFPLMVGWNATEHSDVMMSEVAGRVDGLVVLPSAVPHAQLDHVASRVPVVVVSVRPPPGSPLSSVTVDNIGGIRALTDHLIVTHGLRDLWFVGRYAPSHDVVGGTAGGSAGRSVDAGVAQGGATEGDARFEGFRQALQAAGLPVPEVPPLTAWGRESAHAAVSAILGEVRLPDGIVCVNDQSALGVIDALREVGIDVPGDVAVTGFDGIDAGRFLRPGLTTVRQPMDAIGRVAVQVLADQVGRGDRTPVHRRLPVQVVLRETCGCTA